MTTSSGQPASFGVASVKPVNLASHPVFGNRGGPGTPDPGRIHLCCVGMFSLLMRAYDVEIDQIIGPSWIMENMGPNLYQIDATMSPGTTKAQFQLMMQNLLVERFQLAVHRETRNFPGYELVVGQRRTEVEGIGARPERLSAADIASPPPKSELTALSVLLAGATNADVARRRDRFRFGCKRNQLAIW